MNVILYGFGPLGVKLAALTRKRPSLEIVGAVDLQHVGKDTGTLAGGQPSGILISNDANQVFRSSRGDVALHATSSQVTKVLPQIKECISAGLDVITSCEELAFPFRKYPLEARELDAFARKKGRRVIATGINPGYLMDKLPLILTGVCEDVSAIKVTRVMYSGIRRTSFQDKIGTGLELAEFQRLIDQKVITGHVGLVESITMIVDALGWQVDSILELPAEPVIAEKELTTYTDISKDKVHKVVKPGQAAGLKSIAQAKRGKKIVVSLEWISHAGVSEPYDAIEVQGTPNIHQRIDGGVNGDIGTVSLMVNCIERLPSMNPGFYTMRDVNAPVAIGV